MFSNVIVNSHILNGFALLFSRVIKMTMLYWKCIWVMYGSHCGTCSCRGISLLLNTFCGHNRGQWYFYKDHVLTVSFLRSNLYHANYVFAFYLSHKCLITAWLTVLRNAQWGTLLILISFDSCWTIVILKINKATVIPEFGSVFSLLTVKYNPLKYIQTCIQ